jgi:hypothetical protein
MDVAAELSKARGVPRAQVAGSASKGAIWRLAGHIAARAPSNGHRLDSGQPEFLSDFVAPAK